MISIHKLRFIIHILQNHQFPTQNPSWNLLTVCYPPTPEDGWGVDEHTDLGFLTILNQDQVGGLEVKE